MQSPRFRAIMHVTSGRKMRVPDIQSISHELNSEGVRPLPLWKPRAYGHVEVASCLNFEYLITFSFNSMLTANCNLSTSRDHGLGKKVSWGQSKSLQVQLVSGAGMGGSNATFSKEMQSPRFRAIMHVTSGRKMRVPDIQSISHELNSEGVRPLPLWKPRAYGHVEPTVIFQLQEIMVMLRGKFEKLKEEVNADPGIFAGDLVGILEETPKSHPEWKELLEDLLIIARKCAKMTPNEFWLKCESIVESLDDKHQELPMGILKQVH
ncbi:hypothetical protein L2E82_21397 [Cichorium intybus]|uniref:Uncharacterized protein n=1 Tax=Cichorium intybus TaxID=13427 RepID=A0ACB9DVT8_CICIN|nr:hypothetical protein L2E82_21397 [Cichorium intybus]